MLPKVPDVEPAAPRQQPVAEGNHVLRIGQARVPQGQLRPNAKDDEIVTVVTGLPRSGTSMMMQMLHAAGLSPLTDELRQADEDNPRGYFEFQAATQLRDNPNWVADARGKVIKVVAQLMTHLPQEFPYRVIFMQRDIEEVLASQRKMLARQGKKGSTLADDRMKNVFQRQLVQTHQLLNRHHIPTLVVSYTDAIERPNEVAAKVAEFLGKSPADAEAIAAAVDPALYRQRREAHSRQPHAI